MKNTLYVLVILGLLLAGCQKENNELIEGISENEEVIDEMVEISANVDNATTTRLALEDDPINRKIKVAWEAGTNESFSLVFESKGCIKFTKSSLEEAVDAIFTGKAHTFDESTNLYGIYPSVSSFSKSNGITWDFNKQDGSINDLKKHDYMVFVKEDFVGSIEDIVPYFKQKIAVLKLTLKFDGLTAGTATNIGLSAKNLDTKINYFPESDSYKNLATGDITASGKYSITNDGNTEAVFLAIYPQTIKDAKIIATVGYDIYEATLSDNTLQAGRTYTINKTLKKATSNSFENENISGINGSSPEKAYEISNAAQILLLANRINNNVKNKNGTDYKSAYYKLTSSIDLSSIASQWTPINSFSGTLDGNGYTISNINVNSNKNSQGFFSTSNGTISNLTINGTVKGNKNVGGLVGYLYGGSIENCVCNVEIEAKGDYAGGLVGCNQVFNTIENCHTTGSVTGNGDYVGGLTGNNLIGYITACYSDCNVISTKKNAAVGGLSGGNGGSIVGCYSTGNVTGNDAEVGGIVGRNQLIGSVYACYATGNTGDSKSTCGGIIGSNSSILYDGCYFSGNASKGIGSRLFNTNNAKKITDITTEISSLNKMWAEQDGERNSQFNATGSIVEL